MAGWKDWCYSIFLSHFSQPAADRVVYRQIRRRKAQRIVEVGMGSGIRAHRMIRLASAFAGRQPVAYTGIDQFEARPANCGEKLTLKEAHRLLSSSGAKVRLVPGDPRSALSGAANSLPGTDLLLISCGVDATSLEQAWFFVPRLLHPDSVVLREIPGDARLPQWSSLTQAEIAQLAQAQGRRRAA